MGRWRPYIIEASAYFDLPECWIEAVMRLESGGLAVLNGRPITSPKGAMGLMQITPHTYETLRMQYGLGGDPYDPRDNILAGTAYLRQMYDRFGGTGFLAAYNAGPTRYAAYLQGLQPLPEETIRYLQKFDGPAQIASNNGAGGNVLFVALAGNSRTAMPRNNAGLFFTPSAAPR